MTKVKPWIVSTKVKEIKPMQYVFIKFDEANYATNISQVVNLSDEQAYYHCACSEFRNQCGSGSEEEFINNYGHWQYSLRKRLSI